MVDLSHKIPNWCRIYPRNTKHEIIDEVIKKDNEAFETAKIVTQKEGLFVGISTGANVFAALEIAKKLESCKNIVTIAPDNGERYFSISQYYNV